MIKGDVLQLFKEGRTQEAYELYASCSESVKPVVSYEDFVFYYEKKLSNKLIDKVLLVVYGSSLRPIILWLIVALALMLIIFTNSKVG